MNNTLHQMATTILQSSSPLWRLRFGRLQANASPFLFVVAALSLSLFSLHGGIAIAQAQEAGITGLNLKSEDVGTLTVAWDAVTPAPRGYDINWAEEDAAFSTHSDWNVHSTDTSYTITGLAQSEVYKVRVRTTYDGQTGPWIDEQSLKVSWQSGLGPFVLHSMQRPRIRERTFAELGIAFSYGPRDEDPATLDLSLRSDVVDTAGRDENSCEQEGMGEPQERYLIEDRTQQFTMSYGSRLGNFDCIWGDYFIVYSLRDSNKVLYTGHTSFSVYGVGGVGLLGQNSSGFPTVSGEVVVGETLTVDTSNIRDPDGLSNAVFSYQWLVSDGISETEIIGATGRVYTVTQQDEGKFFRVRVSFMDDVGNDEFVSGHDEHVVSLPTSPARAAAVDAVLPLTANIPSVPGSHDGQSAFTFELLFSEEPGRA